MENLTVKQIVQKYLEENGFDGLQHDAECSCKKSDLFCCGEPKEDCTAGVVADCTKCDDWNGSMCINLYDFCIGEK